MGKIKKKAKVGAKKARASSGRKPGKSRESMVGTVSGNRAFRTDFVVDAMRREYRTPGGKVISRAQYLRLTAVSGDGRDPQPSASIVVVARFGARLSGKTVVVEPAKLGVRYVTHAHTRRGAKTAPKRIAFSGETGYAIGAAAASGWELMPDSLNTIVWANNDGKKAEARVALSPEEVEENASTALGAFVPAVASPVD